MAIVINTNWGTVPTTVEVENTVASTISNWDFGDGTVIAGQTATHNYGQPGTYTITLTTNTGTLQETVEVVPPYEVDANTGTLFLPVNLLNDEQFASIVLRRLNNQWPTNMYDNGGYPLRTLRFWPVPTAANAVELWLWEPLFTYDSLDDELNLPPGYERYLRFKLAVELAPEFGKEVPPTVMKVLMEAEENVKKLNQQIPVGRMSQGAMALTKNKQAWNYLDMIAGPGVPGRGGY